MATKKTTKKAGKKSTKQATKKGGAKKGTKKRARKSSATLAPPPPDVAESDVPDNMMSGSGDEGAGTESEAVASEEDTE